MKTLAARMVLATSVALATLAAAETANAQDYHSYEAAYFHRRHAAPPYACDTQANPNYGFGPLVPVDPNTWFPAIGLLVAIPTRSSAARSCASTARAGRTDSCALRRPAPRAGPGGNATSAAHRPRGATRAGRERDRGSVLQPKLFRLARAPRALAGPFKSPRGSRYASG